MTESDLKLSIIGGSTLASTCGKMGLWEITCRFLFNLRRAKIEVNTAAVDRSDRSVDRAIGSIDSIDSTNFWIFAGELEICLLSKFQLCTTLGGRKNTEKPKWENF